MRAILFQFLSLLPSRVRLQIALLLPFMAIASIVEVAGFATLAPIVSLLEGKVDLEQNRIVQLLGYFMPNSVEVGSVEVLCLLALSLVILSLILNLTTNFALNSISCAYGERLTTLSMFNQLKKPFLDFKSIDKSTLVSDIVYEPQRISKGVLYNLILFYQKVFSVTVLLSISLYYSFSHTLFILVFFLAVYACIFIFQKAFMAKLGKDLSVGNKNINQNILESYDHAEIIHLKKLQVFFAKKVNVFAHLFYRAQVFIEFLAYYQKYLIEVICVGGIITYILSSHGSSGGSAIDLSLVSFFVIIGYKLMPQANDIFRYLMKLKSHQAAFEKLKSVIEKLTDVEAAYIKAQNNSSSIEPLTYKSSIDLESIDFSYGENKVLSQWSLSVRPNELLGIYGGSGKGKTTMINVLMGLLQPQAGQIKVDSKAIESQDSAAYQSLFSYVPQESFILNASIKDNIAFGVSSSDIDEARLAKAIEASSSKSFIEETPGGLSAILGEGGVNLSGGQKQRLAIARALYFETPVIVFDESTNSLDKQTEAEVMKTLQSLSQSGMSIIMVTHNPELRNYFDRIIDL